MSEGKLATLLASSRRLAGDAASDCSDADLLERFATQRDEAAFASLLGRHGPLVWSVCRRVLAEEHAAEDAFQATFLVLVRRARSVRKQASLRSWLHGVALRVALRVRQQERLRHRRERETPGRCPGGADWRDLRPILDEEIQRLPEKYRLPVVLCHLEGHTNDEAARVLNCPRGTIATRLARAHKRLRSRLLHRGVTLSAGTLATVLTHDARSASASPLLLARTAKVVRTGAAPVPITTLAGGVSRTMFLSKLKTASLLVLILVAIGGAGVGTFRLYAQVPVPESEDTPKKPVEPAPDKPAAKAPETATDTLAALMQERLKLAQQEVEVCVKLYQNARAEFDPLAAASKDLLKAELELSATKADRLAAYERFIKLMEGSVAVAQNRYQNARASIADLKRAQYLLIDARIDLEREKARK